MRASIDRESIDRGKERERESIEKREKELVKIEMA